MLKIKSLIKFGLFSNPLFRKSNFRPLFILALTVFLVWSCSSRPAEIKGQVVEIPPLSALAA